MRCVTCTSTGCGVASSLAGLYLLLIVVVANTVNCANRLEGVVTVVWVGVAVLKEKGEGLA